MVMRGSTMRGVRAVRRGRVSAIGGATRVSGPMMVEGCARSGVTLMGAIFCRALIKTDEPTAALCPVQLAVKLPDSHVEVDRVGAPGSFTHEDSRHRLRHT